MRLMIAIPWSALFCLNICQRQFAQWQVAHLSQKLQNETGHRVKNFKFRTSLQPAVSSEIAIMTSKNQIFKFWKNEKFSERNRMSKKFEIKVWGLYHKTYYGCYLWITIISRSICLWQAVQPRLVFVGKAGAYSSEAPYRCYTLGFCPYPWLERFARDKHYSLS